MEISKQQADFEYKPQDAFEYFSNKEAQGDRQSYTLVLRGKPSVSQTPTENNSSIGNIGSYVPSSLTYGLRKMDFTDLKTSSERSQSASLGELI